MTKTLEFSFPQSPPPYRTPLPRTASLARIWPPCPRCSMRAAAFTTGPAAGTPEGSGWGGGGGGGGEGKPRTGWGRAPHRGGVTPSLTGNSNSTDTMLPHAHSQREESHLNSRIRFDCFAYSNCLCMLILSPANLYNRSCGWEGDGSIPSLPVPIPQTLGSGQRLNSRLRRSPPDHRQERWRVEEGGRRGTRRGSELRADANR